MSKPYFGRWVKEDLRDLIAHQLLFARLSMSAGDVDRLSVATANSFCIQILLSQNTAGSGLVPFDIARKALIGPELSLDEALAYADEWIDSHGGCIRADRNGCGRSMYTFIPPNNLTAPGKKKLNKILESYFLASDTAAVGTIYISPISSTSTEPTIALRPLEAAYTYAATAWDLVNDKALSGTVKFERVNLVSAVAAAIELGKKLASGAK